MRLVFFFLLFFCPITVFAKNIEVYYVGFSYLGEKESELSGMPLTTLLIKEKNGQNILDFAITDKLKKAKLKNFNINFALANREKGNSIMMSIGVSKEIFSLN